ncbi:hypothetical protein GNX71_31665 [Variovorax sp. RKNM96]|uniref:SMI1/KNR4 family protein n=1 Tax=Variovorax sp. RKNM96 TaxID=2681552 RepID=UPI00197EA268|nr:SMI1/KNR4 family protein [Variovorax sp. RKNM96]QSI33880.1 hypothetical protein GNX71_31665 [Variovorax sp. RKNM96]
MEAEAIVADWKRRLVAMAENPPYVFSRTPQNLIEEYQSNQMDFIGFTEAEILKAELLLRGRFPAVFREYLLQMGRSPGRLFRGSELANLVELEEFRVSAEELIRETDTSLALPPSAAVFLFHQGCCFTYVLADGSFDSSPMQWIEQDREPTSVAATFADMVSAELQLMEENDLSSHKSGGYWLTVYPGGATHEQHPARASGVRPLDMVPR